MTAASAADISSGAVFYACEPRGCRGRAEHPLKYLRVNEMTNILIVIESSHYPSDVPFLVKNVRVCTRRPRLLTFPRRIIIRMATQLRH